MFTFPEYSYNRNAYNNTMRRQNPSRSSYYSDPFGPSLVSSPFYDRNEILREKQRHAELERRKQFQRRQLLSERQRQLEREEAMERQLQREREEEARRRCNKQNVRGYPFPPGTIIRGRDGRLYRVVGDPEEKEQKSFENREIDDDSSLLSDVSPSDEDDESYSDDSLMEDVPNNHTALNESQSEKELHLNCSTKNTAALNSEKDKAYPTTNTNKKTITLVVEDVPIEEDEELRDLYSVWRNRAPSPGQWMEPIENFDGQ